MMTHRKHEMIHEDPACLGRVLKERQQGFCDVVQKGIRVADSGNVVQFVDAGDLSLIGNRVQRTYREIKMYRMKRIVQVKGGFAFDVVDNRFSGL